MGRLKSSDLLKLLHHQEPYVVVGNLLKRGAQFEVGAHNR